jgi:hypothetical protein
MNLLAEENSLSGLNVWRGGALVSFLPHPPRKSKPLPPHQRRSGVTHPTELNSTSQYPVVVLDNPDPQPSAAEHWFLDLYHALGPVGVLVLKSLAHLTLKGGGAEVQISRETLARHCGRSVRTVSRAVGRLKALQLTAAAQPPPQGFDCWEPNVYRLTPLGLHLAALLGTGGAPRNFPDLSARDTGGAPVPAQSDNKSSEAKTSASLMTRAEKIGVFPQARADQPTEAGLPEEPPPTESPVLAPAHRPPGPQLDPALESLVQDLERADPLRFAHMREWIRTKLRAGIPRRHLAEALAALAVNLDRVTAWAGWVQNRLEDLARVEQEAARVRERTLEGIRQYQQKIAQWEQERAAQPSGGLSLTALVAAERTRARSRARQPESAPARAHPGCC